jgi:diguanylate cyclase
VLSPWQDAAEQYHGSIESESRIQSQIAMADKPTPPPAMKPADIARDAFRQLATRRIAPTPEAYREAYDEISGNVTPTGAELVLSSFADSIAGSQSEIADFGNRFKRAVVARDWKDCGKNLGQLLDKYLDRAGELETLKGQAAKVPRPVTETSLSEDPQAQLLRDLLARSLTLAVSSLLQGVPDLAHESEALGKAVKEARSEAALNGIATRLKQLCFKIETSALGSPLEPQSAKAATKPKAGGIPPLAGEDPQVAILRDLLTRTLTLAVASLLQSAPELAAESEKLGESIQHATTPASLNESAGRLKHLCFQIELKSGDIAEQQELLLRLFKLLLENIKELLDDDSWLSGQIAGIQNLLAGPISHSALKDATRSMKEVIYKQGVLKHSLTDAKVKVKNMMITFIDRLAAVATTTSDYHEKIELYSQKISQAQDINELNLILDDVMRETRATQEEALRSRDQMIAARTEVQSAEARIHELESKLEELSEQVREDQLTGSLNRRGLEDIFEREVSRADRNASPLCVAMLDLDDFKRLNDTHGHLAGDQVLIHLVKVIKETLRTMDIIGRFGGEEFMIVMPDTPLDDAMHTITRLQRELTKQIFMYNNEKILITFSAGVALRLPQEEQTLLIKRADEAMYKAKKAGKNRVVAAD